MGEGRLNNALAQLAADLKEHHIDYMVREKYVELCRAVKDSGYQEG